MNLSLVSSLALSPCRGQKLMAQHFDAIVVDCDNEQNAALLFKSAQFVRTRPRCRLLWWKDRLAGQGFSVSALIWY